MSTPAPTAPRTEIATSSKSAGFWNTFADAKVLISLIAIGLSWFSLNQSREAHEQARLARRAYVVMEQDSYAYVKTTPLKLRNIGLSPATVVGGKWTDIRTQVDGGPLVKHPNAESMINNHRFVVMSGGDVPINHVPDEIKAVADFEKKTKVEAFLEITYRDLERRPNSTTTYKVKGSPPTKAGEAAGLHFMEIDSGSPEDTTSRK